MLPGVLLALNQLLPPELPADGARLPALDDATESLLTKAFQEESWAQGTATTTHTVGGTRRSLHGTDLQADFAPLKSMGASAQTTQQKDEFAYGELPRSEFIKIFNAVGAKPGETYYDLGAGEGKSVAVRGLGH